MSDNYKYKYMKYKKMYLDLKNQSGGFEETEDFNNSIYSESEYMGGFKRNHQQNGGTFNIFSGTRAPPKAKKKPKPPAAPPAAPTGATDAKRLAKEAEAAKAEAARLAAETKKKEEEAAAEKAAAAAIEVEKAKAAAARLAAETKKKEEEAAAIEVEKAKAAAEKAKAAAEKAKAAAEEQLKAATTAAAAAAASAETAPPPAAPTAEEQLKAATTFLNDIFSPKLDIIEHLRTNGGYKLSDLNLALENTAESLDSSIIKKKGIEEHFENLSTEIKNLEDDAHLIDELVGLISEFQKNYLMEEIQEKIYASPVSISREDIKKKISILGNINGGKEARGIFLVRLIIFNHALKQPNIIPPLKAFLSEIFDYKPNIIEYLKSPTIHPVILSDLKKAFGNKNLVQLLNEIAPTEVKESFGELVNLIKGFTNLKELGRGFESFIFSSEKHANDNEKSFLEAINKLNDELKKAAEAKAETEAAEEGLNIDNPLLNEIFNYKADIFAYLRENENLKLSKLKDDTNKNLDILRTTADRKGVKNYFISFKDAIEALDDQTIKLEDFIYKVLNEEEINERRELSVVDKEALLAMSDKDKVYQLSKKGELNDDKTAFLIAIYDLNNALKPGNFSFRRKDELEDDTFSTLFFK